MALRRLAGGVRQPGQHAAVALLLLANLGAAAALAQPTIETTERLAGDRPEAWGMKFAAAVIDFGPVDSLRTLPSGTVELGFEAGSIPSLSVEEQRIGFGGSKVEEIDRGPLFGRLRARIGLPRGFDLTVGLVPPADIGGLEPLFASAAVGHALWARHRWRLGAWLAATTGRLAGDITCARDTVAAGDDPAANPLGCSQPSDDRLELDVASIGLGVARAAASARGLEPYASAAMHRVRGRFEVDAVYSGVRDRSVLTVGDWVWSFAVGAGAALSERWQLAGEIDYTPLDLRRLGEPRADQSVWNGRLLLSYRLR